jgi:RimM N-terminal domain
MKWHASHMRRRSEQPTADTCAHRRAALEASSCAAAHHATLCIFCSDVRWGLEATAPPYCCAAVIDWATLTCKQGVNHVGHIPADTRTADDSGAAHQDTRQIDSGAASPEAGAAQAADWIEVGLIRSVHGLRGEVKVEPLTDSPAERLGTAGARHAAVSTTCMLRYCSLLLHGGYSRAVGSEQRHL